MRRLTTIYHSKGSDNPPHSELRVEHVGLGCQSLFKDKCLEKLILQLISTRIPLDYVDISLIRKCNTIDFPALQSATKTCEKSLLKYLSFSKADNSYCDRVSALLDEAEAWGSHIFCAYTNAEVHSIKGSPGDIANIGIFSDNADKTIFEFLESFELGYIDWGNN